MRINHYQKFINFSQSSQNKKDDNKKYPYTDIAIVTVVATGLGGAIGEGSYHLDQLANKESIKKAEQDKVEFQKTVSGAETEVQTKTSELKTTMEDYNKTTKSIDKIVDDKIKNIEFKKVLERFRSKFSEQITRVNEGKPAPVPNGIMLIGDNVELNNKLIDHLGKTSDCDFVQIKNTDNILTYLKKAKTNYESTGKRTLLHVDNFDQLLNSKITEAHVIADLKDIMSDVSADFHSTIIFSAKDPSKLDSITIQPHRVEEKIEVNIAQADYEKMKPAIQEMEEISNKVKPSLQKIKEATGKLSEAITKENAAKEKLQPLDKKIEELNNKLKNLPRTKLWAGLAIGFATGIIGSLLLYSNSGKNSNLKS